MAHLWPWLALAAAGALHGLNPATGWVLAACDPRSTGQAHAIGALLPIGVGHVAALVTGAIAVPIALQLGLDIDRLVLPAVVAGVVLLLAAHRWRPSGRTGMALCSFVTSTAHGAGWMLVPALIPLCAAGMPGREITASGSLVLVLAAVGLHMAAMLATTAAVTVAARRALASGWRWMTARA